MTEVTEVFLWLKTCFFLWWMWQVVFEGVKWMVMLLPICFSTFVLVLLLLLAQQSLLQKSRAECRELKQTMWVYWEESQTRRATNSYMLPTDAHHMKYHQDDTKGPLHGSPGHSCFQSCSANSHRVDSMSLSAPKNKLFSVFMVAPINSTKLVWQNMLNI